MTVRITELLLDKYLSDSCSKEELKFVEEYLSSIEGKQHLDQYLDRAWENVLKERVDETVLEVCRKMFLEEVEREKHMDDRNGKR
ncbi:hypothetical protein [Sphingobacterium sp.]|uniref:hypothetical protein n=1 Tax=Sphingobacterium sp. TaxID=341027 RepID=UPI00289F0330|nr:hypothetical protein [Sphingobacterium sp.]